MYADPSLKDYQLKKPNTSKNTILIYRECKTCVKIITNPNMCNKINNNLIIIVFYL